MLADAPNGIAKLRELILQLAVQGKLVPQNLDDEPAAVLLERIKAAKERLVKEKKIKKSKKLPDIKPEEIPFKLPDSWEWAYLANISINVHYGYTASANHDLKDVRLLRITDIQNNRVNWLTVPGCQIEADKLPQYKLNENDLLIARTGGTIGKSYLISDLSVDAVFASYLIRIIPAKTFHSKYFKLFLESELYWNQLYAKSMGTGQPNVNATSLKSLKVSIPPFVEQKRIVEKVDRLMELCDKLETQKQQQQIQRANSLEYVGIAAIYRGKSKEFIYPDLMMKVKLSYLLDTKYIHRLINSRSSRIYWQTKATGTSGSMPKINQLTVNSLPVPLPPLAEQNRIVAKVNQLMTYCDELEAKLTQSLKDKEKLMDTAVYQLLSA